jgi:hypothetical protein
MQCSVKRLRERRPQTSGGSDPRKPLLTFSVADLHGNTRKLASLEGKDRTDQHMGNVVSSMCGGSSERQKLYEGIKDHGDAVMLSFRGDEDLGKSVPYIVKHRYTFPSYWKGTETTRSSHRWG